MNDLSEKYITMSYCPQCGKFEFANKNSQCSFCEFKMISTGQDKYKWESKREREQREYEENILKTIKDKADFSEKTYFARLKSENKLFLKMEKSKLLSRKFDYNQKKCEELESKTRSEYIPKCPICGSPKIHKIPLTNKAGSVALFGIFSVGHVSKTFKCDNCGAKF